MNTNYYTLKEVSEKIKTPIAFLRKSIKEHKLIAHFIGRQYLVSENDLIKYISSKGVKYEK